MPKAPKIKRNSSRLAQHVGQQLPPPPPAQKTAPTEVPEIVERYMALVGRVIVSFESQEKFGSKEANAVASIGRAVALLQAIETSKASLGPGQKPVEQMTTQEIKEQLQLTAGQEIKEVIDADFEDTQDDDE